MEYVDGEGTAAARATIEAHLADCAACRALVDEQRGLAATLGSWHVAPAPESLNAPVARLARTWWRPSRTVAAGVAAAAVVVVGLVVQQRPRSSAPGATVVALGGPGVRAEPVPSEGGVQGRAAVSSTLQARPAAESPAAARQADRPSPVAPRGPSVIRTARLQIVTRDFATARESVESVVNANGGFVDDLTVTGDTA
jgi:anti-sigma factor RsiW